MKRRTKRPFTLMTALILIGGAGACDRSSTEPRFDRPAGPIVGLDRAMRLSATGELGGDGAMTEISNQIGAASLHSTDPLVRAVAEWQAKQGTATGPSATTRSTSGVQQYEGEYYVWSNGQSYAPAHKQARIYDLVGRVSRIPDAPIDVVVTFKFDGHQASNDAEWTLKRANGDEIRSRPLGSFGSQTDPFMNMTVFANRGWAAAASEQDVGCDVKVNGKTTAKAWYVGGWDIGGISIGVNPAGAGGSINFIHGKRGEAETTTGLNTQFTCPPPGTGGGGDGYEGGDDCVVCQQWFLPLGEDYFVEWWECGPGAPSMCEPDVI